MLPDSIIYRAPTRGHRPTQARQTHMPAHENARGDGMKN